MGTIVIFIAIAPVFKMLLLRAFAKNGGKK